MTGYEESYVYLRRIKASKSVFFFYVQTKLIHFREDRVNTYCSGRNPFVLRILPGPTDCQRHLLYPIKILFFGLLFESVFILNILLDVRIYSDRIQILFRRFNLTGRFISSKLIFSRNNCLRTPFRIFDRRELSGNRLKGIIIRYYL